MFANTRELKMVHVLKIVLEFLGSDKNEIRRIAVNDDVITSFGLLAEKIETLFPVLAGKTYLLGWKDEEGDFILMSSDEELAQAIANNDNGLIKVFVRPIVGEGQNDSSNAGAEFNSGEVHSSIICDGCEGSIRGIRYKCLECKNYDLCSVCNNKGVHMHHDMMKLVRPYTYQRNWEFLGVKKLWKSLFPEHCRRQSRPNTSNANGNQDFVAELDINANGSIMDLLKSFLPSGLEQNQVHNENIPNIMKDLHNAHESFSVLLKTFCKEFSNISNNQTPSDEGKESPQMKTPTPASKKEKADKKLNTSQSESALGSAEKMSNSKISTPNASPSLGARPKIYLAPFPLPKKDAKENLPAEKAKEVLPQEDAKEILPQEDAKEILPQEEAKKILPQEEAKKILPQEEAREKSPASETSDGEVSNIEGWTMLNPLKEDNNEKINEINKEGVKISSDKEAKGSLKEKEKESEVSKMPGLDADKFAKVANALMKMQSMGFTNEGGWLERLLIAKDGNINNALDSLYPNTQRH